MWNRKCNRCNKGCRRKLPLGSILVALGAGLFLAYIIPYYFLISLLGIALIVLGICLWLK